MPIINFPVHCPSLFLIIAIIWCAIQGISGYWYGVYIYDSNAVDRYVRPPWVRWFAYGFHHGAFYFLCSLSGFIAWYLALQVKEKIGCWSSVSGGMAAILTALLITAILGITGALPRILFLGKNPLK